MTVLHFLLLRADFTVTVICSNTLLENMSFFIAELSFMQMHCNAVWDCRQWTHVIHLIKFVTKDSALLLLPMSKLKKCHKVLYLICVLHSFAWSHMINLGCYSLKKLFFHPSGGIMQETTNRLFWTTYCVYWNKRQCKMDF